MVLAGVVNGSWTCVRVDPGIWLIQILERCDVASRFRRQVSAYMCLGYRRFVPPVNTIEFAFFGETRLPLIYR